MELASLLSELRVPYRGVGQHSHARPGWVQVDCPWCARPGHWRLGISINGGYANCWTCGGKRLDEALALITGLPAGHIRKLLKGVEGVGYRSARTLGPAVPRGNYRMPAGVGPLLPQHRRYLRRRGFNPAEIVQLWGVGGIGLASQLSWRLYLPIIVGGQPVSWTTRSIGDGGGAKYISASPTTESLPIKSLLYGIDYCRSSCVVVEGPLDAWAIGPGAVAVLGLSYTRAQVRQLAAIPQRCICFDNEPDAQMRATRLAEELKVFPGVTHIARLTSGKDPAEADPAEVAELRGRFLEESLCGTI